MRSATPTQRELQGAPKRTLVRPEIGTYPPCQCGSNRTLACTKDDELVGYFCAEHLPEDFRILLDWLNGERALEDGRDVQ